MAASTSTLTVIRQATKHLLSSSHAKTVTRKVHRRADRAGAGRVVLKIRKNIKGAHTALSSYVGALGVEASYKNGSHKHIYIIDAAALAAAEKKASKAYVQAKVAAKVTSKATVTAKVEAVAKVEQTQAVAVETTAHQPWTPSWTPTLLGQTLTTEAASATPFVTVGVTGKNWADLEWD
jgi:hypothetical protein